MGADGNQPPRFQLRIGQQVVELRPCPLSSTEDHDRKVQPAQRLSRRIRHGFDNQQARPRMHGLSAASQYFYARRIVPTVQNVPQDIKICACRHTRKEISGFETTARPERCPARVCFSPAHNRGLVEQHSAYFRAYAYHLPQQGPPPSGVFPVRFDRFSPYFTEQKSHGLDLAPMDYYALCYPFRAVAQQNMAYFFQDMNLDAEYVQDVSEWLFDLRHLVSRWQTAWVGAQRPVLQVTSGESGVCVQDNRDGTVRAHRLDTACRAGSHREPDSGT